MFENDSKSVQIQTYCTLSCLSVNGNINIIFTVTILGVNGSYDRFQCVFKIVFPKTEFLYLPSAAKFIVCHCSALTKKRCI